MCLNCGSSFTGLNASFGIVTLILLDDSMGEKNSPNIIRTNITQMISLYDIKIEAGKHPPASVNRI